MSGKAHERGGYGRTCVATLRGTGIGLGCLLACLPSTDSWARDSLFQDDARTHTIDMAGEVTEQGRDLLAKPLQSRREEISDYLRQSGHDSIPCRRFPSGYRAHWQIRDDELQLVRLELDTCLQLGPPLEVGHFGLYGESPAKAHWFTGHLKIPRGKPQRDADGGSRHRQHVILIFQRGKVLSRTVIND